MRTAADGDTVVFHFKTPATPNLQMTPAGHLEEAFPPFTADPSGLPLDVVGSRFVKVSFDGQTLVDVSGTPTYTGDTRIEGAGAIAEVVQEGAYEGVSSWLIGFDGPGCVSLSVDAATHDVVVRVG